MENSPAGFREVEHAADWALQVWAPQLDSLLEQAARGMLTLAGIQVSNASAIECEIEITFLDREQLLVKFLSELLYFIEQENLAFTEYQLSLDRDRLKARVRGYPIRSIDKAIKAVTYHNLEVRQTERGYEAYIVFDV
ncbi:MAG: protein archease [Anaerolineae bacterium]|jgi:SHS2 domain-containing protein|nr:MAG: protein archease [Anaerolineae bacterium]